MLVEENKDDLVPEKKALSATETFLDKLRGERTNLVRVISSKPNRVMFPVNHNGAPTKKGKNYQFKKRR